MPSPKRSKSVEVAAFDPDKKIYKIAVISDLHFGSRWANVDFLNTFIEDCKNQDIKTLLCAGDVVDGYSMYTGQEKEVLLHSAESYEEYAEDHYPRGFKSYYICGNHDESLCKIGGEGYSFCKRFSEIRDDLIYLPAEDKLTKSVTLKGGLTVNLYHGSKSCANVRGQDRELKLRSKVLGMMASGIDADLHLFGHCHRVQNMINYMGRSIIGLGCFQNTTPYLESRGCQNDVCGQIIRYQKGEDGKFLILPEFKFERDYA